MKNNFVTLLLCINLMIPTILLGQGKYEDVVYLKNGSIIHGIIIEQVPNQTIKIQTKDRNVFVFKLDEVEKFTKEPKNKPKSIDTIPNGRKKSGYTNITEINLAFGINEGEATSFGLQTINGYQINPHFSIGLGLGIDTYKSKVYFPLFLDLRVSFLKTTVTPFFDARIGYSFVSGGYKEGGGGLISPSLGIKYFVSSKMAINLSIGVGYQPMYGGTNKNFINFASIKFGATF